jgi:hypothetical protein
LTTPTREEDGDDVAVAVGASIADVVVRIAEVLNDVAVDALGAVLLVTRVTELVVGRIVGVANQSAVGSHKRRSTIRHC